MNITYGGWGSAPIYNSVNLTSYLFDKFSVITKYGGSCTGKVKLPGQVLFHIFLIMIQKNL